MMVNMYILFLKEIQKCKKVFLRKRLTSCRRYNLHGSLDSNFQTGTWSPSYGANITLRRFLSPGVFGNKTLNVSTLLVRTIQPIVNDESFDANTFLKIIFRIIVVSFAYFKVFSSTLMH